MSGRSLASPDHVHKVILLCVLLLSLSAARGASNDWDYHETHNDAREFAAGGMLHVHISVGDLHIKRGDSDKLRLNYTVKSRHERSLKEARVDFDVHGDNALIEFHAPARTRDSTWRSKCPQIRIWTCMRGSAI